MELYHTGCMKQTRRIIVDDEYLMHKSHSGPTNMNDKDELHVLAYDFIRMVEGMYKGFASSNMSESKDLITVETKINNFYTVCDVEMRFSRIKRFLNKDQYRFNLKLNNVLAADAEANPSNIAKAIDKIRVYVGDRTEKRKRELNKYALESGFRQVNAGVKIASDGYIKLLSDFMIMHNEASATFEDRFVKQYPEKLTFVVKSVIDSPSSAHFTISLNGKMVSDASEITAEIARIRAYNSKRPGRKLKSTGVVSSSHKPTHTPT